MTKHYADNYEEITGKKRDEDIETGVQEAPVAEIESDVEDAPEEEAETKVIKADSKNVKTA